MSKEAFPLSWPPGFPRTVKPKKSPFEIKSFEVTRQRLFGELRLLRASDLILSTNIPLRNDGMPYANRNRLPDPGVAIYFKWRGEDRVLACDRWDRIEDNLHAIELTIAALRGLERWGASDILRRAFTGMTALPAPPQWWDVLEVREDSSIEVCEANYRVRIQAAHPDRGGSEGKAASLNWAITEARREKGVA